MVKHATHAHTEGGGTSRWRRLRRCRSRLAFSERAHRSSYGVIDDSQSARERERRGEREREREAAPSLSFDPRRRRRTKDTECVRDGDDDDAKVVSS